MLNDSASGNKIKENKYKILRMSLLLGNDDNREETINNFEDASRDIDAMNDEVYLKEIESKFYDTLTLEEEEKKLAVLVDYIGGRVDQRISLINDFANVTGFELVNLSPIKYEDKLDEFKDRLKYIREYLDNTKKIESLNNEINELENRLEKTYSNKEKAEERNKSDEKVLLDKFKNIIDKNAEFKDVDINNIDAILDEVASRASESKKSLDIFNRSFSTLTAAGISYEEEQEYLSYVNSARDNYYKNKEQEYLLNIYKLLVSNESEYNKLLYKRDTINSILYERINLRKELSIKEVDSLGEIYDLLDRQYKNIKSQKNDIDNIDVLSREINTKRDMVKELELDNQKVEILSLLKEFCIIDTYDEFENSDILESGNANDEVSADNDISLSGSVSEMSNEFFDDVSNKGLVKPLETDLVNNEVISDNKIDFFEKKEEVKEEILENQVIDIIEAKNIDLGAVIVKANSVMKRVGKMLGVDIKEEERIVSVVSEPVLEGQGESFEPIEDISNNLEPEIVNNNNLFFDNNIENNTTIPNSNGSVDSSPFIDDKNNDVFLNADVTAGELGKDTADVMMPGDDFWTSTFDDGGLSSLPDLPVSEDNNSNNFFVNNNLPDLNFDFGNNGEGQ